jgi:hypothetical protein
VGRAAAVKAADSAAFYKLNFRAHTVLAAAKILAAVEEKSLKRSLMFAALLIAMTGAANAGGNGQGGNNVNDGNSQGDNNQGNGIDGPRLSAPEIDPSSAIAGLTLLTGGLVVLRGKRER